MMDNNNNRPVSENVQVIVRCRPLNEREEKEGNQQLVKCIDKQRQIIVQSKSKAMREFVRTYNFDCVYGPDATQRDLFVNSIKPIVEEVLNGYNCTIFAYGTTGTGKTYTMEGPRGLLDDSGLTSSQRIKMQRDAGIISRSVNEIFCELEKGGSEYSVRVSHLELYNEELFDLLSPHNCGLRLMDDPKLGVTVHNLEEFPVTNPQAIFDILEKSWEERRTAETNLNKNSSRSHCVFSISILMKEASPDGEDLIKVGKLNLVDLAGSENINRSGADQHLVRKQEAGNINRSLLTLGRVITALTEGAPHVPYRESKLTRLLRDSLGGRTKTCIIATISPASFCLEETISTLDYGFRAKNIKNRPEINQKMAKREVIKEYTNEINLLRSQLECMRAKNGVYLPNEQYNDMTDEMKENRAKIQSLEDVIERKTREFEELRELFDRQVCESERTERLLESTEMNLNSTKNNLLIKTQELSKTRESLEEQKYLVQEHSNTENSLHTQAQTVINTLNSSIKDIEGFFLKIDRLNDLNNQNSDKMENFKEEILRQLRSSTDQIGNFVSKAQLQVKDLSGRTGEFVKSGDLKVHGIQQKLSDLERNLGYEVEDTHKQITQECQGLTDQFSKIRICCDDQQSKIAANNECQENRFSNHVQSLDRFNRESMEQAEKWTQEKIDSCKKQENLFERNIVDAGKSWSSLERDVTNLTSNISADLLLQDSVLSNFIESQMQAIEDFRTNLLDQVRKQVDQFATSQIEVTKSVMQGVCVNLKNIRVEADEFQASNSKRVNSQLDTLQSWRDSSSKINNENLNDLNNYLNKAQVSYSDFASILEYLKDHERERVESEMVLNTEFKSQLGQLIDNGQEDIQSHLDNTQKSLRSTLAIATLETEKASGSLNQHYDEFYKFSKDSNQITDDILSAISDLRSNSANDSAQINQAIKDFILEKYLTTGKTPIKRVFEYPRELHRTKSHDVLLTEFRNSKVQQLVLSDGPEEASQIINEPILNDVMSSNPDSSNILNSSSCVAATSNPKLYCLNNINNNSESSKGGANSSLFVESPLKHIINKNPLLSSSEIKSKGQANLRAISKLQQNNNNNNNNNTISAPTQQNSAISRKNSSAIKGINNVNLASSKGKNSKRSNVSNGKRSVNSLQEITNRV